MTPVADLTGKTAIITGAAGGIGRATARLMASRGASVVVADLKGDVLETAALINDAGGRAVAVDGQVAAGGDVEEANAIRAGPIAAQSAGSTRPRPMGLPMPPSMWQSAPCG